jgi:hypothetical protein
MLATRPEATRRCGKEIGPTWRTTRIKTGAKSTEQRPRWQADRNSPIQQNQSLSDVLLSYLNWLISG